jgi:hypothetical protein
MLANSPNLAQTWKWGMMLEVKELETIRRRSARSFYAGSIPTRASSLLD